MTKNVDNKQDDMIVKQNYYKVWWDANEGVGRNVTVGEIDADIAKEIFRETVKLGEEHGGKINWLVDVSKCTKVNSHARKIFAELSRHQTIKKFAFVGAAIYIRVVVNFVLTAAGQKNARHFLTEVEALEWLKEK